MIRPFFSLDALITNAILFALAVCILAYLSYVTRPAKNEEIETPTYAAWLKDFVKRRKISIFIAAWPLLLGTLKISLGALLAFALFSWLPNRGKGKSKVKYQSHKELLADQNRMNREWLAELGDDHARRLDAIERIFESRNKSLKGGYFARWSRHQGKEEYKSSVYFEVERNLAAMPAREREFLRVVEKLNSAADGAEEKFIGWRIGLLWGDGKGMSGRAQWLGIEGTDVSAPKAIDEAIRHKGLTVDKISSDVLRHIGELRAKGEDTAELKAIVEEADERLSQGGGLWLKSHQIGSTIFEPSGQHRLHIGTFGDGTALSYGGEGSMITIAPPGSGKTQCNVFPNLLSWKGPAVVLDISGDIYEHTSRWRQENVGPVYKFSPLEPDGSHRYNPLTFVRSEPDYIWEDAKLLAELMIVPSNANDPFWENEARTVLTAAIAHVCYQNKPDDRALHKVLDIMFGGEAWSAMIVGLRTAVDVRVMVQHGSALGNMNEKTLGSVLQTARSSLGAWTGERIARVTAMSDWSPLDLRDASCPTVYIHMRPNEVEAYLSLLRVFIGQHIRMLTGGPVPPRGSPPILVMLDELPRLRYMPPVDEALNIGRKYGLRLWMFAQSVGQLKTAYENAEGMLGSCAVRIFMNPSGADGLSDRLSEEIGYVESLNDGSRKKLVEAAELAGPAYREQQIVFGSGARPARVSKDFAWRDPALASRLGAIGMEAAS